MSVKTAPRFSLGKNGPLVSRMGLGLGLGTMGLTRPTYRAIPIQGEIFAFLDHAYEAGVTFWDSADYYNDCEEIIGNCQTFELNTSYVYVKKACAESLRLLDIESIDLSYLHTPNPETPIEETMRALKELQDEGKIKCIGLSAVTSTTLRRAAKIAPGTHILDTCRELDLAIVAATPLGRGLLTANFIDGTASGQQDSDGIITARLAIAWLLKQGDDIIPIPETKRIQYFEENWAALDIVLSGEEEAEIRKFVEKADIASVPLPPALDGWLFRDTKEESV
ncbi:hypothetical protein NW764_009459 [Fusarium oxysporum]|nr:hypothetical protein NW764_009459 [Fusarium oxysporum]